MDFLIKALQLILSISILVITHEAGHFFFAKLFKTRVEKFYLFFDPWFSLFKIKRGETEYGIGWLPLGGYVKIAGMVDESMDTDQLEQPVQPWEFRAKPAWQRLLIMLGGVLVNAITAPIIFWFVLYTWGESYLPLSEAKFGMCYSESLKSIGFADGDRIDALNGEAVELSTDVANAILLDDSCTVTVVRGDTAKIDISTPPEFFRQILANKEKSIMTMRIPSVIDSVLAGSGADKCGLQHGDSLVAINGVAAGMYDLAVKELDKNAGKTIELVYSRNGQCDTTKAELSAEGKLGFYPCSPTRWMSVKYDTYSLGEALPAGVKKGYKMLKMYVKQLPLIFTKEGASQIGGFGAIGSMFPSSWDWHAFWHQTAFLAIILAFMNILPIPALDGGHVLFLLVEIITRRKPSDKFLEYAQVAGMILLFGLLIYANGNDIYRAIFD